jgi:hypothetical protein
MPQQKTLEIPVMTIEDPNIPRESTSNQRVSVERPQAWSLSPLRHYHMEQQPWVAVPPELVQAAGDPNAGLLLADIVRFLPSFDDENVRERPGIRARFNDKLWLMKSQAALVSETGLTDSQVRLGIKKLQDQDLIERLGRLEYIRPTHDFILSRNRKIRAYAGVVRLAGNAARGLILSQMNYWFSPGRNQRARVTQHRAGHLWVAKRYEEWAAETGLTRNQVVSAVKGLSSRGLIHSSVHRFAGLTSLFLRFDEEAFRQAWEEQHTLWWESQAEQRRTGHGEL